MKGSWGRGEKGTELEVLTGSHRIHRGVKYSRENTVNHITITLYGARWVLKISGGSLCKVYDRLTTMLCTSNSYKIMLCANCNWKIKFKKKQMNRWIQTPLERTYLKYFSWHHPLVLPFESAHHSILNLPGLVYHIPAHTDYVTF